MAGADFDFEITNITPVGGKPKPVNIGVYRVAPGRTFRVSRQNLARPPQSFGDNKVNAGEDPFRRVIKDMNGAYAQGRIAVMAGGKPISAQMTRAVLAPDGSSPVVEITGPTIIDDGIESAKITNDTAGPFTVVIPDPRDHEGQTTTLSVYGLQDVIITAFGPPLLVGIRALGSSMVMRPSRKVILRANVNPVLGTALWEVIADSDDGDVQVLAGAGPFLVSPYASTVLVSPTAPNTTLTLPRIRDSEFAKITIKDANGTAAVNLIDINSAAGDAIDGGVTTQIATGFGAQQLFGKNLIWLIMASF